MNKNEKIRPYKFGYYVALAVSLVSVFYPSVWIIAEVLGWDAGVFN